MPHPRGLVILHIDGVGYDYLRQALAQGRMPFVQRLIETENYEALRYRCGVPSTTPFCQAGILYGDNSEIPSFRWWDKESGLLVAFGGFSSFRRVAHKYFRDSEPLAQDGACIGACYPAGAVDTFGLAYRERSRSIPTQPHPVHRVLVSWIMNPLNAIEWLVRGIVQIIKGNVEYWRARLGGRRAARNYVISDVLEEIFLHQLTRFAVIQAMGENYPVIYAGFYAYDETAHAFGPRADYSFRNLRHIDNTIRRVATRRLAHSRLGAPPDARDYELVILSDHGQIETIAFREKYHRHLAEFIAEYLPTYEIEEYRGKKVTPDEAIDGHIALTYSGGLAHLYFKDISRRLDREEIEGRFPGFVGKVARTPGVGFVLLRDTPGDCIVTRDRALRLSPDSGLPREAREFLSQFDDAEIMARQLQRLNSFERSGDLILFGEYIDGQQINFENQVGGHGSVGGEQLHPFILVKREWGFDTSEVFGANDLYPQLKRLKDQVLKRKTENVNQ